MQLYSALDALVAKCLVYLPVKYGEFKGNFITGTNFSGFSPIATHAQPRASVVLSAVDINMRSCEFSLCQHFYYSYYGCVLLLVAVMVVLFDSQHWGRQGAGCGGRIM